MHGHLNVKSTNLIMNSNVYIKFERNETLLVHIALIQLSVRLAIPVLQAP